MDIILGAKKMNRRFFISSSIAVGGVALLSRFALLSREAHGSEWKSTKNSEREPTPQTDGANAKSKGIKKVIKTDAEWKQQLTPQQYNVLRQKGTEYAGTSPLVDEHRKGTFECAGCGLPLFSSEQKFESGTGWPSFWAPIKPENVIESVDRSFSMTRTEVLCAQCDGHLGHLFDDGPKPTGLRYCMNGVALKFVNSES
jgi:peptide-methionine (R)-S-oxide reductase